MADIIRGTTPTIKFIFNTIEVANITTAYFSIKNGQKTIVQKDLSSAIISSNSLAWKLSQQESFLLPMGGSVTVVCDWKLADGTRGRSKIESYRVAAAGKSEII